MRRLVWAVPLCLALLTGCRPNAVWSPDGKQLALDPRGTLFTYNVETRKFRQFTRGPQTAVSPVWSPDGSRIAYHSMVVKGGLADSVDLMSLDPATGQSRVIIPKLRTMSKQQGGELGAPPDLVREMLSSAWSPDGKRIAYTAIGDAEEPTLWVANADGSSPRSLLAEQRSAYNPVWSPDGTRLAFLSSTTPAEGQMQGNVSLEVVNADGGERKKLWDGTQRGTLAGFGPAPRWSADGKSIWVTTDLERKENEPFGNKTGFWRVPADGSEPQPGPDLGAPSAFLTANERGAGFFFAPKDQNEQNPRVGFAGPALDDPKVLGTLDPAVLGIKDAQAREVDGFPVPALSPDGSRIAVAFVPKAAQPVLLLYPTAGGKPERVLIPVTTPKPPVKAAPKKPAPKKPVRKARGR